MDREKIKKALKLITDERRNVEEGASEWRHLDSAARWLENLLDKK